MDPMLRRLLHATNPWLAEPDELPQHARGRLPERFVPRSAADGLRDALVDTRRAHLVVGPRQAGKSTLIWSLIFEDGGPLLYLSCEEPLVRQWCASPGMVAAELDEWVPRGGIVFFEEAQWLDDAGLFLKGLVDAKTGRRLVATGSASFHLLARTRESLAGRATRHAVWPLSLDEAARPPEGVPAAARREIGRRALERQLLFGGFPEAWTSDDPESVLRELVTAFVLRDASDRFRIERPDALRLLLRLAAGQVGDLVKHSEWGRVCGIATSTVIDYVSLLAETHVLGLIRPFVGGRRAELTQAPKVYFLDTGLRNAVAGGFAPLNERVDAGKLLECWVFGELHKRHPEPGAIRYWRTKGGAEVDFVLEPAEFGPVGIEVKSSASPEPRITRSMRAFVEAYDPARFLVVHRGEPRREKLGQTIVDFVPAELLPAALGRTSL
ncbi:MAG: ATP-binding protein [Polyangia bacterium]